MQSAETHAVSTGRRETWLAMAQGVREAGFKEELRYELVADVALAICELTEREVHDAQMVPFRPH